MKFYALPTIASIVGLVAELSAKATKTVNNIFTVDQTINGVLVGRGGNSNVTNTVVGASANLSNTTGNYLTGVGVNANRSNTTGSGLTGVGANANYSNTTGNYLTGVGLDANRNNTTGNYLTGVGLNANYSNTTGSGLTGVGTNANYNNTTGNDLTGVGVNANRHKTDGSACTDLSNITGVGANTRCSASNQVQLGDAATTTYVYGTVQNRSDIRDKADVRDTLLGLAFINALRPVDYKWDMRDDYLTKEAYIIPAELDAEGNELTPERSETRLIALPRDGSKKRGRYHHGLIAQEVADLIVATGMDFGGYQDHSRSGGSDVKSIGYDEFIAPLIKAVQELSARVRDLENKAT